MKIEEVRSKTDSELDYELEEGAVHVGPSDHVPWLEDRKFCHIRIEGTTYGDVPLLAELKLEVWDSPNSAGVITDAIRCAKIGLDRKSLSEMAIHDPAGFDAVVAKVKQVLAA